MTIHIFELTIKMIVEDRQSKYTKFTNNTDTISKEEIVSECLEHVLNQLEQIKAR